MMRSCRHESRLRKGPWSAEEDEVLINFVNENGPRGWSSIQSNGLLPRTGKSCRLRWVNKLRPNLKVGCKFSAEEERIVVELQARFGNKWATIASHLSGRTDNDVKNFWSSRKKRLARTLNSTSQPEPKRLCRNQSKQNSPPLPQLPSNLEVPDSRNSMIQVGAHPSFTYNHIESSTRPSNIETASSLPEPIQTVSGPVISTNLSEKSALSESSWFNQHPNPNPAPVVSESLWTTLSYNTLPLLPDHHQMNDFESVFAEPTSFSQSSNGYDFDVSFFGGSMEGSCNKSVVVPVQRDPVGNLINNPDGFFDDFPTDVFDCLDPLPTSFDSFH